MKATARIPISANGASNPGVVVVVVDLVVLVGSGLGVVLVVVAVVLVSETGVVLVVFVVDLVTSGPGVVVFVVDLVTSAAAPRARNAVSIIVAISVATNIFFISKPL
jgi:hypothetical protein